MSLRQHMKQKTTCPLSYDITRGVFLLHWVRAGLYKAVSIAFHISHLEKADVALFGSARYVSALSLFPFPPPRSLTPPHIFVYCLQTVELHLVWDTFSRWGVNFLLNHGGHRGSQLEPAAPEYLTLRSSEQRVRFFKERNAAYCWSGKKWVEESLLKHMILLLNLCVMRFAQKTNRAAFLGVYLYFSNSYGSYCYSAHLEITLTDSQTVIFSIGHKVSITEGRSRNYGVNS